MLFEKKYLSNQHVSLRRSEINIRGNNSGRIYIRHFQQLWFQILEQNVCKPPFTFWWANVVKFFFNAALLWLLSVWCQLFKVSKYSLSLSQRRWCSSPCWQQARAPESEANGTSDTAKMMCVTSRERLYQPVCASPRFFFLCYTTVSVLDRGFSASQSEGHVDSPRGTCHKTTIAESHGNGARLSWEADLLL